MSIRLYPAYDPWHEGPDPDRTQERDRHELMMQRIPYGYVMDRDTTRDGDHTVLVSPGETFEQYQRRMRRRAEAVS